MVSILFNSLQTILDYFNPYTALAQFDEKEEEKESKDRNELIDENLKRSVVLGNCLLYRRVRCLSFMTHFEIKTFKHRNIRAAIMPKILL